MKGLAGLTLLSLDDENAKYEKLAHCFRESGDDLDESFFKQIESNADYADLMHTGIHIGPRFTAGDNDYKTVYIPLTTDSKDKILAISYLPEKLVGSDFEYNTTLFLLFLIITLISLLIVNLIFKDFIMPLQHLVLGMEKTAQGEVLYQIEDVRQDEIGRVTSSFNKMSASLWDQRRMLTASNKNLFTLNERMKETLNQLAEANNSLAKSEAFLSKLITNAPFPVIVTDTSRKIITFSDAALKTFEISEEEVIGRDLTEFFPFAPDRVFPQTDESSKVIDREMICGKTSGENFPVLLSRVSIREANNDISAYLFILRDISESKSFQEMIISIDRMATRGVMAGEIAHEVNNYLAIILGNVELLPLLLSKGKMDKVDHKLEVLRQTVTKIQRFSEGLMGYGDDEAVFIAGDLNQLVENMVVFLKPQNRYDGITWKMDLSSDIPLVSFDSSQMQQLMVNILNNAADALKECGGTPRITITTGVSDDKTLASITIADNAGGLPDDIYEVIFKQRYTGQRRGRGFGLFIVKQIIDKHEGSITYQTEEGKGTSFAISIPVKRKARLNIEQTSQVIS